MKTVTLNNASPSAIFKIEDAEVDDSGNVCASVKSGAVFDGKTLVLEVQDPNTPGVFYSTGISITAIDAFVAKLRPGWSYRLSTTASAALDVTVIFY